jgi:hypothetical protein
VVQEFAVRFALPDFNPNNHLRFNPGNGTLPVLGPRNKMFRLVKNSGDYNVLVTFNQYGLRDSEDVKFAKAEDVIVVGDSFAFGWGVKESERVSEQLEQRLGRKVYNIATPNDVTGYGKLLNYAKFIGAKAENVVVLFNMYDDINDYDTALTPVSPLALSKRVESSSQWNLRLVKEFLLANSSLYFLTTSVITQTDWLRRIALKLGLVVPLSAMGKRSISKQSIASTINHLKKITRGINSIVLLVPNRGIWIGNNQTHERKIHRQFVSALTKEKIRFLDMRTILEREGNPMRYHFDNDGHWRPLGHHLAASALAKRMAFPKWLWHPIK